MKKALSGLFILFIFMSCSKDDGSNGKLRNIAVDVSDLMIYVGSDDGGKELRHNNLKKVELLEIYFKNKYNPKLYSNYTIEFYNDKLAYIYSYEGTWRTIISNYTFRNDSLFAIKSDGLLLYAAEGTSRDRLYRTQALGFYHKESSDSIVVYNDQELDLSKMLKFIERPDLKEMKNPKDTIAWCNVKYIFE